MAGIPGKLCALFAGSLAHDHILTANVHLPPEIGHFWSLAVEAALRARTLARAANCKLVFPNHLRRIGGQLSWYRGTLSCFEGSLYGAP
jgi:hypothetical protein